MKLRAAPVRLFSSDFLLTEEGREITTLDLELLRSRGHFTIDGERYHLRAEGLMPQGYVIEHEGRILARAGREQLVPCVYRIEAEDRILTLRARPPLRRFDVFHGDLRAGDIRPEHLFSRAALAELDPALPVHLRVFLIAIALIVWRRRARAAS